MIVAIRQQKKSKNFSLKAITGIVEAMSLLAIDPLKMTLAELSLSQNGLTAST